MLHPFTVQLFGCDQLVVGATHARAGILDLLMTDIPDLVNKKVNLDPPQLVGKYSRNRNKVFGEI